MWGGGVGGVCKEYSTMLIYYNLMFYIFIFVDLVKRRVLIPAGEISLYRNDDSYILLYAEKV